MPSIDIPIKVYTASHPEELLLLVLNYIFYFIHTMKTHLQFKTAKYPSQRKKIQDGPSHIF